MAELKPVYYDIEVGSRSRYIRRYLVLDIGRRLERKIEASLWDENDAVEWTFGESTTAVQM